MKIPNNDFLNNRKFLFLSLVIVFLCLSSLMLSKKFRYWLCDVTEAKVCINAVKINAAELTTGPMKVD